MKKGFTLIELLAVIVILAIIALIATPIVLNIVDETKKSATLRGAEFYLDAVEQSIAKKSMSIGSSFSPDICIIQEDGNLICDGTETLKIDVNGEVPSGGSLTFDNGKITAADLDLSNKTIKTNEEGNLEYYTSVCTRINGNKNKKGSLYECEVKPGTKYNFYILSKEEDGTTNLIMDRNICRDGSLSSSTNRCGVDYDGDEINYTGPYEAMGYLNSATANWEYITNLDLLYDDENGHFTDFAITGKARLPYYSEVADYDRTNGYLYNNLTFECYSDGLYNTQIDCESATENQKYGVFEEGITHVIDAWGYWTLARTSQSNAANVIFLGVVEEGYYIKDGVGVRPVINVKL